MLPVLDFRALATVLVCFSLPIILTAIATLLAGSAGAEAETRLAFGRHLLATACGGAVGWLVLATLLVVGTSVVVHLAIGFEVHLAIGFIALIGIMMAASVLSALAAYHTAKYVSRKLGWRRCTTCGRRFRFPEPIQQCKHCRDKAERTEPERAVTPSTEYKEL